MSVAPVSPLDHYRQQLAGQAPFALLPTELCANWFAGGKLLRYQPGQYLLRPDELPERTLLVLQGQVRLLVNDPQDQRPITLEKRGPGQLLGWASLLRGEPCEWVSASEPVLVLALPADGLVAATRNSDDFRAYFARLSSLQEAHHVALQAGELSARRPDGWQADLASRLQRTWACTLEPGQAFTPPPQAPADLIWHLSTPDVPGCPVGRAVALGEQLPSRAGFLLPYRLIGLPEAAQLPAAEQVLPADVVAVDAVAENAVDQASATSLRQLGILEADRLGDGDRYPVVRGRGQLAEAMAVCEMVALQQRVPFRRDAIAKVLEDQFRRDKTLSLELIAGLCELLGMNSQLAEVDAVHLASVEAPALLLLEGIPVVLFQQAGQQVVIGHPHHGIQRLQRHALQTQLGESFRFALPRRLASTPTSRFGWGWFTPLLRKYRVALVLVFVASLLAQLFGLAIPLLIQQIIDKVLTQGNLSSLNVLGAAMVVMALFQGVLTVLRGYIFVDTTDRMDLTLGSAVIDRMLALPLSFFERRPVGELSQRLGELNTIRSFLTGTALVSVLNIIFATLYLAVMLVYSPLLTAVALSSLPLYVLLVFGVAPIYKTLIRKRAVAQARTQSHLIEVLNGIQTVKAQHFELTARWKWQDRYRHFVDQGFKSVALGSAAGEIGNFLNQLSGLLVLWVGMWLVLEGNFTLGQLIAFRIISSNVTGPLLQLSGLYQGFQGVQLSMERLSDIIDQNPELGNPEEIGQIALPSIHGDVRFEGVSFRFGRAGANQVDNVSVAIPAGSFVGVVGQSGSGKSTLMKLLPRLYDPQKGRIFIDDYDIGKVDLSSLRRQIGIVPQDSLLFEGTIAENIALNDPQASTEAILEAARIACAHEFIMGLGQGYATPLTEKGSNLSGGQRQRIAIARTILANPQLLVMDEATSALDYNTERQLCLNLQQWAAGRTVFFITHRLTTIQSSDVILVMHQGRLEESGTHHNLMQASARYATLFQQQAD
ncbi:peptidase domain-containing ABC transporter [Cyanobium sp. Aljojuca 7D2]|uniref:ABC transporter transmembrane domain-containing protein n=1 Tax=Cyanobium sp. Aljojuca 7D2 TaxID=2823698 RepID=UPI0020CC1843|nr:peptidase domain-containing ABC transporter [Cyanobium sp. Aljojuca 7D2]MCP9891978.1 peptidase domain-containing ABC transporter [Cyanobium sp. Aljojuca 7D2]